MELFGKKFDVPDWRVILWWARYPLIALLATLGIGLVVGMLR